MSNTMTKDRFHYEFGPFQIDSEGKDFLRGGKLVKVERESRQVLLVLLQRPGKTVKHDEIIRAIWGALPPEGSSLARHIANLRKAFGKRFGFKYITTNHGVGYAFAGEVKKISDELREESAVEPHRPPVDDGGAILETRALTLYYRKSHEKTYDKFRAFCTHDKTLLPQLIPYNLTPDDAIRSLSKPTVGLNLLECSLPMAMAILSRRPDDFRITGFLDVAQVRERASSCSIYYHNSPDTTGITDVDLLVPSLHSMTTVSAGLFVTKRFPNLRYTFRPFPTDNDDPYDQIIDYLAYNVKQKDDLRRYIWVIDEAIQGEERRQKLESAIGLELLAHVDRKDLFAEMFKLYDLSGEALSRDIPGMFVIASNSSLKDASRAQVVSDFLKNWIMFAETEPELAESKTMGPFESNDLAAFANLLHLAAIIAKDADQQLEITRPLRVSRDFFDVALISPNVDTPKRKAVLINSCTLLYQELKRLLSIAEDARLRLHIDVIKAQADRASSSSAEADLITHQLRDTHTSDLPALQNRVLKIRRETRAIEEALIDVFQKVLIDAKRGTSELARIAGLDKKDTP
jgi:DNA-binding winged helix-turn-helix (wHTH) protein